MSQSLRRRKPAVVAHRGSSGTAPENTLSAVRQAISSGAVMCEVDVHTTRDGQIVVMHDSDVSRTTDGRGLIAEMDLAEIRRLDAGSWFKDDFAGEGVPTLGQVMDALGQSMDICIEVKNADPSQVLDCVLSRGFLSKSIMFDFNHDRLYAARNLESGLRTLALGVREANLVALKTDLLDAAGAAYSHTSPELVDSVHDMDLALFVYTANHEDQMRQLAEWGVDAIITNFPRICVSVVEGM
jgi:glycerophosphoryl diester phosphodiesterase